MGLWVRVNCMVSSYSWSWRAESWGQCLPADCPAVQVGSAPVPLSALPAPRRSGGRGGQQLHLPATPISSTNMPSTGYA